METIFFSYHEKIAVTISNGEIEFWEEATFLPLSEAKPKVFGKSKKTILKKSGRWESHKKHGEVADYLTMWMGEYPWDSWCLAVAQNHDSRKVSVKTFDTEINPRGLTDSEYWLYQITTQKFWDSI